MREARHPEKETTVSQCSFGSFFMEEICVPVRHANKQKHERRTCTVSHAGRAVKTWNGAGRLEVSGCLSDKRVIPKTDDVIRKVTACCSYSS